jgi:hypothetical protein
MPKKTLVLSIHSNGITFQFDTAIGYFNTGKTLVLKASLDCEVPATQRTNHIASFSYKPACHVTKTNALHTK